VTRVRPVTRRRFPLWTALGTVLIVALVLGSGVLTSSPPTAAQRAVSIESVVRCPTCEDLSVAQSTAPTAVAVRVAITQLIAEGRTDQQIQEYLAARYGSSIVLDPPASGWSLLVWLLPLVAGLVATSVLVVVLVRRRRLSPGGPGGGSRAGGAPLTPAAVEERREFLTRSLADADAEYLAGDLSDQDYLALRQRDMLRLAALPAQTDGGWADGGPGDGGPRDGGPAGGAAPVRPPAGAEPATTGISVAVDERAPGPEAPALATSAQAPADSPADSPGDSRADSPGDAEPQVRGRSRRSWWFLGGAVVAFGAALILAVSLFATNRQPGQSITGSFAQSQQQQIEETLGQAATDEDEGQAGRAAQLYQSVLDKHPDNEVALAQLGWLEYETGVHGNSSPLIADARVKIRRAVHLDPGDYAARLYLGTVLLQRDDTPSGAVDQYRRFLADGPPAALVKQASPEIRAAFGGAGLPVPSGLSGG
jgi:cytochrome c-type biogenesis protein CcmH